MLLLLGCVSGVPDTALSLADRPPTVEATRRGGVVAAEARAAAVVGEPVIVTLNDPPGTPMDREAWARGVAGQVDGFLACAGTGAALERRYRAVPALVARIAPEALDRAAGCPQVESIVHNRRFRMNLAQSLPLIGAPTVRAAGADGRGTAVAIIDSGIDAGADGLGGCVGAGCRVVYGLDVADGDSDAADCDGHGTNVAAIAAGSGGVAPGADIVALKVFSSGSCDYTDDAWIAAAIDEAVVQQATYNIVAINMSLGVEGAAFDAFCDGVAAATTTAVRAAYGGGIFFSVAAGNDGYADAVSYPACLTRVYAVANTYDSAQGARTYCLDSGCSSTCTDSSPAADSVNCSSNGGALIAIAAPGTEITAGGETMSGTSPAAPHLAGAAALVASALPGARPSQWMGFLERSRVTVTDPRSGSAWPRLDLIEVFTGQVGDLALTAATISGGDGDDRIESREALTLSLTLENTGPGPLTAVSLSLSNPDPDLSLGSLPAADIAGGAAVTIPLALQVADCAADHTAALTLSATDSRSAFSEPLDLPIYCVLDEDGDGVPESADCDDGDPGRFPGNPEVCDGVDQDCDGAADNAAVDAVIRYEDGDGDGVGGLAVEGCDPAGLVAAGGDCDDARADVAPGLTESCDGADNDCDGTVDEEAADRTAFYADGDGDGYGDPGAPVLLCGPTTGYVTDSTDCDDADPDRYPEAPGYDAGCRALAHDPEPKGGEGCSTGGSAGHAGLWLGALAAIWITASSRPSAPRTPPPGSPRPCWSRRPKSRSPSAPP